MSVLTRTKGTGGKLRNVRHKCNTNDITAISVLLGREFQVLGRKMMILFWGFFFIQFLLFSPCVVLLNHAKRSIFPIFLVPCSVSLALCQSQELSCTSTSPGCRPHIPHPSQTPGPAVAGSYLWALPIWPVGWGGLISLDPWWFNCCSSQEWKRVLQVFKACAGPNSALRWWLFFLLPPTMVWHRIKLCLFCLSWCCFVRKKTPKSCSWSKRHLKKYRDLFTSSTTEATGFKYEIKLLLTSAAPSCKWFVNCDHRTPTVPTPKWGWWPPKNPPGRT